MKKIVLLSTVIACALTLALTSCLPDAPGYTYTNTFSRIVTIDHGVTPPRFYCDYTNDTLVFSNIKTNADLGKYNLTDAPRALITGTLTMVDYDVDYTLGRESESIEVMPVCNKDLVIDDTFGPVYGFSRLEVERTWAYPYAWVSRGYLNIIPQIKSNRAGEHLLVPEGVSGDTLSFSLRSKYTTGDNVRAEFACYDLRTLGDTLTADAGAKQVMTSMINSLNQPGDSVMVVVVADYLSVWPDTIVKTLVPTNHFYLHID